MGDLTARILEVVARIKAEQDARLGRIAPPAEPSEPVRPPAPAAPGPSAMPAASPPDPAEVARVLGLPLDQLDRVLEVRVPWLPVSLWFVPDEEAAEALAREGVTRGRVWTAVELADLLSIPNITKAGARTLAVARLAFDGDVVGMEPAP